MSKQKTQSPNREGESPTRQLNDPQIESICSIPSTVQSPQDEASTGSCPGQDDNPKSDKGI